MSTYSVRLHAVLKHSDLRRLLGAMVQALSSRFAPMDVGGSYSSGEFDIWLTVSAADGVQASHTAEEALRAAASQVGGTRSESFGAATPPWLELSPVDVVEVVLVGGNIDVVRS